MQSSINSARVGMFVQLQSLSVNQVGLTLNQTVLSDINLELTPGIHVFLGPNGAGKTMTNRILALVEEVTAGKVRWNGEVVNPFPADKLDYIRRIGYMRQEPVFLNRSVRANLAVPLKFREVDSDEMSDKLDQAIAEFDLADFANRSISQLSTGQRQRVALARTLLTDPDLVILDEPTASLDMATTKWFEEYILDMQDKTEQIILWTTHDQFQVRRIADTVSIIIAGQIRSTGTVTTVLDEQEDPQLQQYLTGELIELE